MDRRIPARMEDHLVNSELRTDVWNDMIHTDGLVRYYGELAGKLARRQQVMAIVTSVLAMVSLVVSLLGVGTGWTSLSIGLAVTASFFPLIYRVSGKVTTATYCQKRLGDLMGEWRALWQEVDTLPVNEVRDRWQRLDQRMNEITSLMSSGKMDEKLRDSTEKETDSCWETHRNNKIERQKDSRYALPA